MAVGDTQLFNAAVWYLATGEINVAKTSGWKAGLSTATFGALTAGISAPQFGAGSLAEVSTLR